MKNIKQKIKYLSRFTRFTKSCEYFPNIFCKGRAIKVKNIARTIPRKDIDTVKI